MSSPKDFLSDAQSPRNTYLTLYGRIAVLEALHDPKLTIAKVVVANNAQGASYTEIMETAKARDIEVRRLAPKDISRISRNGRHDQGVAADVLLPNMQTVQDYLRSGAGGRQIIFLLDGITNPSNVGMILRSVTAAGATGIVLPHIGSASLDPLVVKASAGIAFRSPIIRCATPLEAAEALKSSGFTLYGLSSNKTSTPLYQLEPAKKSVFILGNEREGVSEQTSALIDTWVSIPMHNKVESLNVANAATVVAFELMRRNNG
jgi:23S rRNA (guanosine2251-2'-O)-methyltransferase